MNQSEIADVERAVLDAVALDAEHVPDEETEAYDARLDDDTPIEIKTCLKWIRDTSRANGKRTGRWQIDPNAHETLVELDGLYLLAVRDRESGEPIAALVKEARALNELVRERATYTGQPVYHERLAAISWTSLLSEDRVKDDSTDAERRLVIGGRNPPPRHVLAKLGILPFGVPQEEST